MDYKAELTADFRKFYSFSLYDIGKTVSYSEALSLMEMLLTEPGSWYFAKKNAWKFPFSREEEYLAVLVDLTIASNWDEKKMGSKAPKAPRPYNSGDDVIKGSLMNIERAKVVYKIKRSAKTPEEIKALNKKYLENKGT